MCSKKELLIGMQRSSQRLQDSHRHKPTKRFLTNMSLFSYKTLSILCFLCETLYFRSFWIWNIPNYQVKVKVELRFFPLRSSRGCFRHYASSDKESEWLFGNDYTLCLAWSLQERSELFKKSFNQFSFDTIYLELAVSLLYKVSWTWLLLLYIFMRFIKTELYLCSELF